MGGRRVRRAATFVTGLITTAGFVAGFAVAPASAATLSTNNLGYTPLSTPLCIADTRAATAGPACSAYNSKTLAEGTSLTVDVPAAAGLPASASAVAVSIDAINPAASGFLSVVPAGSTPGTTANVTFKAGVTATDNLVTVGLGTDSATSSSQAFTVYNGPGTNGGNVDFEAVLEGYYLPQTASAGGAYVPLTPTRAYDSRSGSGEPGAGATLTSSSESDNVTVTGTFNGETVPSTASAVVLNVAIVNPTASSYIYAYPTGSKPATPIANQNFTAGNVLSTQIIAGVGTGGDVTIANNAGSTDIVVDIDGYYTPAGGSGALFNVLGSPVRLLDTRPTAVANGSSATATVTGSGATGAALSVADLPVASNYLTVYPAGQTAPLAATVNYSGTDPYNVVENASYGTVGSGGNVSILTEAAPANIVVDEFGYFAPVSSPTPSTTLPELASASIIGTFGAGTVPNATTSTAGTVIQYVFNEALTGATFTAADFKAYTSTDTAGNGYTTNGWNAGGGAPSGVCGSAVVTCATPSNADAVNVLFGQAALTGTTGANNASLLTLATVIGTNDAGTPTGAVVLSGKANPDGSAAIGSSSTGTLTAGKTSAPDIESFGTPRAANPAYATAGDCGAGTSCSAIDVTFDKAAFDEAAGAAAPAPVTGNNDLTTLSIVYATNQGGATAASYEAACEAPSAGNTNASGGTVPGGEGTVTMTVVCPDAPATPTTTLTTAQVSRMVLQASTATPTGTGTAAGETCPAGGGATTAGPAGFCSPLETTAYVAAAPTPSLTGVTLTPASGSTAYDSITYTFDEPVANGAGALAGGNQDDFGYYNSNGTSVLSASGACTSAAPPNVSAANCQAVSNTVLITFVKGSLASAVGGYVVAGGAENQNNVTYTNRDDALGASNPTTSSQNSGVIAAPQLLSVALSSSTSLNVTTWTATYTFSYSVTQTTAGGLHLYDNDGTELTCNAFNGAPTLGSAGDVTVSCSSFNVNTAAGGAATNTQISSAVLGTVDLDAVVGDAAGTESKPAPNANPNPEGAQAA